ncbi:MAG: flagellar biosynthetic protein FliR [Alphaproteobacteria bacterium]
MPALSGILEQFLAAGVLAFILTFVRMGTAVMIMPGLGDSFVPERLRLLIALALSFVLFPVTMKYMPAQVPGTFMLLMLIITEFVIGLFFGTVARIFMTALDTAGMVISTSSGLGNAQVFNPSLAMQGSLVGAFLSVTGVLILFATDLHHLLIAGLLESYTLFPVGAIPDTGSMAELLARTVSASFSIGVKIGAPFIVLTMLIYVGMGVLSRLMPQIQVFLLAIPLQILLSVITLMLTMSAIFIYWAGQFEEGMIFFLKAAG